MAPYTQPKTAAGAGNEDPYAEYACVIVTSTTGNGDAPENANTFYRYVKRKVAPAGNPTPFSNCHFAVLGLGDTNYSKFNEVGRNVDSRLAALGGRRCAPLALADEATGLEDVVEPWTEGIWLVIDKYFQELACGAGSADLASMSLSPPIAPPYPSSSS